MKSSKKLVKIVIKKIKDKAIQKRITGVPSGFVKIDEFTNGWQPGQLIVVAARPGMGMSALTKSMILNTAIKFNQTVAVFSLEKSAIQYMNMMIVSETKIQYSRLGRDNNWCGLTSKLRNLSRAPIFIDDTPSISFTDLERKAHLLKNRNNVKLIVVDYLQLMTFQKLSIFNRKQEIEIICRNLKKLGEDLELPIIILTHLPKTNKKGKINRRPKLSDLRKIAPIEPYADVVAFLYRPEYYGIYEWDFFGESTEGQAEFIIAKNRNGWLNNFRIRFDSMSLSYSDFNYK